MQLHYNRGDYGHYSVKLTGDPDWLVAWPTMERAEMVSALCEEIQERKPKKVEVCIDNAVHGLFLNYGTVLDIINGRRSAQDLTFGSSVYTPYNRMWEAISQWFVLRPMPGQVDMYECPACGRGARLEKNLHCDKCGLTFICEAKYWGVSADLLDSLLTNKDREKYYIDRPWNDHPPWMTRGELTDALRLYEDATRSFTED